MNGKKTTSVFLQEIVKEKVMQEKTVSVNIFIAFTMVGIVSAWLFNGTHIQDKEYGLHGPASIVIWSYMTALISLGCILLIKNITNPTDMFSGTTSISGLLTIFLMVWIVSINVKHFKEINMHAVPKQYFSYSGWSYLLLFIQAGFVFITLDNPSSNVSDSNDVAERKGVIDKIAVLNNVIIFLSFILVLIQQIILEHLSVDVL
jgi:hypothetical protein